MKKRFHSLSKNSLFQGAITLEIPSRLFWRHEKTISFGFGKFAFRERRNSENYIMAASSATKKKQFFSDSENTLFQVVKTLEIASRLFWCYENAISFAFGNLACSGRQNVRNRVKIVLALRPSDFFRIWKIHFLCAPKHKKLR